MVSLMTSITLLVLICHLVQFTKATCFITRSDVFLQNHVIYSLTLPHIGECWQTCKQDVRCQSLNYFVRKLLCEINNRTIDLAPKDAVNVPYTAYFDNPYRVAVGMKNNTPAVSCVEVLKSGGNVSDRYWLIDHARSGVPFMAYCNMTTLESSVCRNSNYCQNGRTCVDKGDTYTCQCVHGFYGNNCQLNIKSIASDANAVKRKVWININPGTVSQLKSDPRYPDNPTTLDYITTLETLTRKEENYGQTLTANFIAPETGDHVFYMTCDDQCQLLVSNDTYSRNAKMVINIVTSTVFRDWEGRADQISPPIPMVAGKLYYIHVIMTQAKVYDSLSVGVKFPSGTYDRPLTNKYIAARATSKPKEVNKDWILIARFSNSDAKNWMALNGAWWYDVTAAQGDTTSKTTNQDMIAPAFWNAKGKEIKITRTDDSTHTALLVTTTNCLGGRTFRAKLTSYGNFRNGAVWASHKCLGSCHVRYAGNYLNTAGFSQARCDGDIQSRNKIGFWCDYESGDGAVMMIGGGGENCTRADHGLGITEEEEAKFGTPPRGACDFGNDADVMPRCKQPYALNLWIK